MNKTILLVDDSSTVRQVMRIALERANFGVLEAGDGEEALKLLAAHKVALVVCDVAMPRMDGLTFVKAMRAQQAFKFIPVIMLTTESRQDRKDQARENGATAWATKPCPPSQLLDTVNRLTGGVHA